MCGIAGFIGFKNDDLIHSFSRQIAHRGPDGEGFYIDKDVSLLSRRLAIIDRKGGDQPIYNEDKSIVCVYNGEIYNYLQLRKELEAKGHVFKTKSDTEVIVHGYEEWGDEAFDKYNGMFGIALYDIKKKRLLLARDHFGIKPFYYIVPKFEIPLQGKRNSKFQTNSNVKIKNSKKELKLLFSSEIKPLIYSGFIERKPNEKVLYRYLRYRIHEDTEETFFKDVHKLMPGEMMIVKDGKVEKRFYSTLLQQLSKTEIRTSKLQINSNIKIKNSKQSDESTTEQFLEQLIKSIQMRLASEVPVGSCLSGGLDSSTVVSIVNKLLKEKVKEAESVGTIQNTFSAVFPGSPNDEERYIDDVLKDKKISSHKVYPEPESFFEDLEDFIRTQEEPTISTGPYAQYKVMQEAHKHVTVVLDGQGADEMMAGYLPYYFVYLRQLRQQGKWTVLLTEIINSFDVLSRYFILKLKTTLGMKKSINFSELLNSSFKNKYKQEKFLAENYNLKKRLLEDIFHNSLPSLLRYEDRNSMRFSIEGRVPFLDFNLLKYLWSLPDEAIMQNGWNKHILRKAVDKENLLPNSISKRRNKIGFTTPEHEWFMRMKNRIYLLFLSESFANRPYFNQAEVLRAFRDFIEGKNDDTMVFWRILNVELWLREFIDAKSIKSIKSVKSEFEANDGKKLEIEVNGKKYVRYPIKTELFNKGDNIEKKVTEHVVKAIRSLGAKLKDKHWCVIVSEKIVAISQGRSYFIWDIKPGFWANNLSKLVTKTPFGIGLGSPWTMQIAIDEVGLPRILGAALLGGLGKLGILGSFGNGIFYKVAGPEVRSIDGPTEYSLYPSNVSAKLGPKEPEKVVKQIDEDIRYWILDIEKQLKGTKISSINYPVSGFQGVVIIDANDLGRNVLGNTTSLTDKEIEEIMRDNPMGQANEQTPIVIIFF